MAYVDEYPEAARTARHCFLVGFTALSLGSLFGLLQALFRTGYFRSALPFDAGQYYTVLTGHGVLLALVFTTFCIAGLFTWGTTRSLGRGLPSQRFTRLWFWLMVVGGTMAAVAILGGLAGEIPFEADVLFTFYPPLKASPPFYIGLALFVVGSWLAGIDWLWTLKLWREDNPDERIPLQAFMVVATMLMWYISSIGVAIEVVVFLIPWSLGWFGQVDPLLMRTLFWYFGHPVVYFWLLPAYFVWYTLLPKLSGGRLVSDSLARIVFVLFLLLSTPVGFHHQYVDPGIPESFKFIAMTNTMMLLLPSLLTAFTVVASIEHGARQRGGEGRIAWLRSLPWENPAFSGCALAGLMFAAGGFSGMVNAGMNINYLVHNTLWVPGHFHLTVGTAFALTIMAISYWLVPQLTGKRLQHRTVAMIQPYVWFLGMALMSNAMHRAGLAGLPRRTAKPLLSQAGAAPFEPVVGTIAEMQLQIAIGGTLLFTSMLMFQLVMVSTWMAERGVARLRVNGVVPEPLSGADAAPSVLDDLRVWTAVALLLIALAYGPPLWSMLQNGLFQPGSAPVPV